MVCNLMPANFNEQSTPNQPIRERDTLRWGLLVIGLGLITMEIDIRVITECALIMQVPVNFP